MLLALNMERARQLQVHTAVEAARIAGGAVGCDAYYARWSNSATLRDQATLDAFFNRRR